MTEAPPRVAAYGYFGMGNIGNEGSLAAVAAYLREAHPDADLHCFAAGADAVRKEHGIPATQLMTFRADPRHSGALVKAAKLAGRLWDVPRTFALMRDVDVLVVPGTGVLETKLMAMPWGLPYWLFVATVSCRLRRRRVVLVSVGAEYAQHPLTRWLYRWTVRLSHHCSYRDEESREAMRSMGVSERRLGGVFPDVAFALPTPPARPTRPGHVVVGVMDYDGGRDFDGGPGTDFRSSYVERMGGLVTRLVDKGRSVTLVVGDAHDHEPAVAIEDAVRRARPELAPGLVAVSTAGTLEEIMEEMSEAEVVLASRFHNVICSLKLGKPTISLGYAEKNAHLLEEFGLGELTQPLERFDVDRLADQIDQAPRAQESVETVMKETLARYTDRLAAQFRELSAEFFTSSPRRRSRAARR